MPLEIRSSKLDFDEYNEVYGVLKDNIDYSVKVKGIKRGDICIDISGGTRAYSAVATVITLNSETVFSYIQTKGVEEEGDVVVYDAEVRA